MMVFDPSYPEYNMLSFNECDWKHFYTSAKESIPDNAPSPRGKDVVISIFVDSDHAADTVTRRSRTGIFIFINMAPVVWYPKKQTTLESSVFGAGFVVLNVAMETAIGLRYKLRMMGVTFDQPTYTYGDSPLFTIHRDQSLP